MIDDRKRLDKAGRFFMEHLRDSGIEFYETLAKGKWKAPGLKGLQEKVAALSTDQQDVLRRCVVASLDNAIHDFLFKPNERADFENDIQLVVDGKSVAPLSDGLQGEPYSDEGWIARFSRYPAYESE